MATDTEPILTKEEFLRRARQIIEADEQMLDDLYPMVNDFLTLGQTVTRIVEENRPLSETAAGE